MHTPSDSIDWHALACALDIIRVEGTARIERGGTDLACEAISILLGSGRLADAVDYYVSRQPGSELARSVLWLIRPWHAMLRCRELFASSSDLSVRRSAVELLRVVADARALPWIIDFLADPDAEIQLWGVGVLDQLVFSRLVEPSNCTQLLELALRHSNAGVRERAAELAQRLRVNDEASDPPARSTRENPVVELWEAVGLGVIIDYPSGVVYSNQTGGFSCLHPTAEGVYVPLRNDALETWELLSPERDLRAFFEGPKHLGCGATSGLDNDDADFIDRILEQARLGSVFRVDRDRLRESHEAWVHVLLTSSDTDAHPIFHGFAPYPRHAVLTWGNSD